MREAADDLVLAADDVAGLQLGREVEVVAALRAEARRSGPARRRGCGRPRLPHDGQNRLRSGTSATAMTACSGSCTGAAGTVVSPAPRRAPRSRVEDVPTRRVGRLPVAAVRAEPSAAVASCVELVRPVRVERSACSSPVGARRGLRDARAQQVVAEAGDAGRLRRCRRRCTTRPRSSRRTRARCSGWRSSRSLLSCRGQVAGQVQVLLDEEAGHRDVAAATRSPRRAPPRSPSARVGDALRPFASAAVCAPVELVAQLGALAQGSAVRVGDGVERPPDRGEPVDEGVELLPRCRGRHRAGTTSGTASLGGLRDLAAAPVGQLVQGRARAVSSAASVRPRRRARPFSSVRRCDTLHDEVALGAAPPRSRARRAGR